MEAHPKCQKFYFKNTNTQILKLISCFIGMESYRIIENWLRNSKRMYHVVPKAREMQLYHMKLQNLVACGSEVLSTWQYHELYFIIPIVFIFFQRAKEKGIQVNLPSRKMGNFITMTLLTPWSRTFSLTIQCAWPGYNPPFFFGGKVLVTYY